MPIGSCCACQRSSAPGTSAKTSPTSSPRAVALLPNPSLQVLQRGGLAIPVHQPLDCNWRRRRGGRREAHRPTAARPRRHSIGGMLVTQIGRAANRTRSRTRAARDAVADGAERTETAPRGRRRSASSCLRYPGESPGSRRSWPRAVTRPSTTRTRDRSTLAETPGRRRCRCSAASSPTDPGTAGSPGSGDRRRDRTSGASREAP